MNDQGSKHVRKRRQRWWILLVLLVIVTGAGWLGREPMTQRVEAIAIRHLHENGVYPRYEKRSWVPWRGLRLEGLTLYRNTTSNEPIIEVSELAVTFPWLQLWKTRELSSHWHMKAATITLHDAKGTKTFQNVTAKVHLDQGKIEVVEVQFTEGPIVGALTGNILFTPQPNQPAPEPRDFAIDLDVIRSVEATLAIKAGTGPFFVRGKFLVDERPGSELWQADVTGNGNHIVWRDLPIPKVAVQGQLSSAGLSLASNLSFTHGSAVLKATRADWERAPIVLTGQLRDSGNRADEIAASYNGDTDTMVVASIRGKANLLDFCRSFPALTPYLPTGIRLRNDPELSLTKLTYKSGKAKPSWSLGALELHSPADLTATVRNQPLAIDQLTGRASSDGHVWRLNDVAGSALGGHFSFSGEYENAEVRNAALELTEMHLKELTPWLGEREAAFGDARLSIDYHGTFSMAPAHLNGSGNLQMENAPVVKVPLLDETYALFGALTPGVPRTGTGELNANFTATNGVVEVPKLTARGEAVTVIGNGKVDLVQQQVDGRARANLHGVVGVATSVVSKALEMKISGPLNHIQVQSLTPLEMFGEGAKGVAELPGKVLKEGVTLPVKIFDWLGGGAAAPKQTPAPPKR